MQTCPYCGASNDANAKFCTTCGKPLRVEATTDNQATVATQNSNSQENPAPSTAEIERQKQVQAENRAKQMAQLKQSGLSYWNYLVDSWKKPSNTKSSHFNQWFGLISMGIWALIGSISLGRMIQAGVNTVQDTADSLSSLFGDSSSSSYMDSTGSDTFMMYVKFFLLLAVGMLVFGLVGFIFRRWAQAEQISYLDYTTDLMHRTNSNLILALIIMLFSLTGGLVQVFSLLLIGLGAVVFIVGLIQSITLPVQKIKFDNLYIAVLAVVVLEIVLMILMSIFGQALISQLTSIF